MPVSPDILDRTLEFIERATHLRTKSFRMLSNGVQGKFLQAFSLMLKPAAILEIGTFTGYSSMCLSRGLQDGGHIDTLEIDDELQDIFTEAFKMAGMEGNIISHMGDAKEIIPALSGPYDIVYIDADKREYSSYYDLIFPLVRQGGYILADNVLWSGKIEEMLRKVGDDNIPGLDALNALPHEELKDLLERLTSPQSPRKSRRKPHIDRQTASIIEFNHKISSDSRVEATTLPIRDGLTVIRKKQEVL